MRNSKTEEINDACFEKIIEEMIIDKSYTWDEFASYFLGLKTNYKNKRDITIYKITRNTRMDAINKRLIKFDKPFKLRVIEKNDTIMLVKKENARFYIVRGTKKTIARINLNIGEALHAIDNPNTPPDQLPIYEKQLHINYGAKEALHGSYIADKRMQKEIKQEILMLPEWTKYA
jgi:hypothetical protein